jgi:hypothetical protein
LDRGKSARPLWRSGLPTPMTSAAMPEAAAHLFQLTDVHGFGAPFA